MNTLKLLGYVVAIAGVILLIEGLVVDASDDYDFSKELRGEK